LIDVEAELPELLWSPAAWTKRLVTAAWILSNRWSRWRQTEHTH